MSFLIYFLGLVNNTITDLYQFDPESFDTLIYPVQDYLVIPVKNIFMHLVEFPFRLNYIFFIRPFLLNFGYPYDPDLFMPPPLLLPDNQITLVQHFGLELFNNIQLAEFIRGGELRLDFLDLYTWENPELWNDFYQNLTYLYRLAPFMPRRNVMFQSLILGGLTTPNLELFQELFIEADAQRAYDRFNRSIFTLNAIERRYSMSTHTLNSSTSPRSSISSLTESDYLEIE